MGGFCRLGLVQNPFGSLTEKERSDLAIFDPTSALRHIDGAGPKNRKAVRFMGEKGRGKSTRLRVLADMCPDAEYKRLSSKPVLEGLSDIGIFDEFQRAHVLKRRKIYKSYHALILSTHLDVDSELKRHGFDTLKIRVQDTTPAMILEIVQKRFHYFSEHKDQDFFELRHAVYLKQKFGDDMRSMMGFLYEEVQSAENIEQLRIKLGLAESH